MELWVPWIFLFATLVGAWFTYNAFRPAYAPAWRAGVSFFAGWLTAELALHHIAWQAVMTVVFIWAGALGGWPGFVGLAITAVSWSGLLWCYSKARDAEIAVEGALRSALGADYQTKVRTESAESPGTEFDWKQLVLPFPIRHPEVERIRDVTYTRVAGLDLKLDVYRPRNAPSDCPVLLQIHGGAWVLGSKNEQGIPLMVHMASRGWICVTVNYRLSPHATFPEQLIDLKRAVAWIRNEGASYGMNPDFIVVTGESAGGHLATLLALTANRPEYQPGFTETDTALKGCISFYGVYDFTGPEGVWPHGALQKLLERQVIKASIAEAPDAYDKASPIRQIHREAPPFLVIHGDRDTVVPVNDARRFCESFRRLGHGRIAYAEIPGAQHAFEIFRSRRALLVIHGVERFLMYLHREYLEREAQRAVDVRRDRLVS